MSDTPLRCSPADGQTSTAQLEQLVTDLQAKDALLSEARKALSSAPSLYREHTNEIERLNFLLLEAGRGVAEERKKRQEAETKERAAVAQQSSLAKARHELDVQVAGMRREVEEEKMKRSAAENRAMNLDRRVVDAENMVG